MPTWLVGTVQWLHVLFGIFWFGAVLTLTFVVVPALGRAPQSGKQTLVGALQRRLHRLLPSVAGMTILLGFVRGTIMGPVTSIQVAFGTAYGRTWAAALVFSIATLIIGARGIGGGFIRLAAMALTADGTSRAAYDTQLQKIRLAGYLAIIGFLAIITCMILMRFGS
jgi:hypothetical protein